MYSIKDSMNQKVTSDIGDISREFSVLTETKGHPPGWQQWIHNK